MGSEQEVMQSLMGSEQEVIPPASMKRGSETFPTIWSPIRHPPDQAVGGTESADRISGQRVQVQKRLMTLCDHAKGSCTRREAWKTKATWKGISWWSSG